jgi:hypothetical protein
MAFSLHFIRLALGCLLTIRGSRLVTPLSGMMWQESLSASPASEEFRYEELPVGQERISISFHRGWIK